MANLSRDASYNGSVSQTNLTSTYNFNTENTFVDKNINFKVDVPGMNLTNNSEFYINDGIYTWNWTVDSSGNVSII